MNKSLLLQNEESRIEHLLQQNESIFSQVKEKVRDINQTSQKLECNIRNIRSPLSDSEADKENHRNIDYSFSRRPEEEALELPLKPGMRMLEEMSFQQDPILLVEPQEEVTSIGRPQIITFIPFNKLYRSPVVQLKSKDRVILARRYKGSSIVANQGRITDGKIYKLPAILTEE